jgi:hypothetical protein
MNGCEEQHLFVSGLEFPIVQLLTSPPDTKPDLIPRASTFTTKYNNSAIHEQASCVQLESTHFQLS